MQTYKQALTEKTNRRMQAILKRLPLKKQRDTLNRFISDNEDELKSIHHIKTFVDTMADVGQQIHKPYESMTAADIRGYFQTQKYDKRFKNNKVELKIGTKRDYRVRVIGFFQWLKKKPQDKIAAVKWIRLPAKIKQEAFEVLEMEDIKKIAAHALTLRDASVIYLLYELGCRRSELLKLKVRHFKADKNLIMLPPGKHSDARKLPIIFSVEPLTQWLNHHPLKDRKDFQDMPMFVNLKAYIDNVYAEDGLRRTLTYCGKRAGITKKHNAHWFRHSRATFLANQGWNEFQLRRWFGWSPKSDMPRHYVESAGIDIEHLYAETMGMVEEKERYKLEQNICPYCKSNNALDAKYCSQCFKIIDLEEAQEKINESEQIQARLEKQEQITQLLMDLMKNPNKIETLKEAIATFK